MNENICKNCDNFMFTYIDEEQKIYNGCKQCCNKEEYKEKYIYRTIHNINISKILDTNKYLLNDLTLPKIKNNPNIKCPNNDCVTNTKNKTCNISYIKYDEENMNFMYICDTCGQKWTNIWNNIKN